MYHSEHLIPEQSLMPDRDPFDPLAALRTMADVQRAGLEAAASVVERILEVGRLGTRPQSSFRIPAQPVDRTEGNGAAPLDEADADHGVDARPGPDKEADRAREVRRLRADGERLLELWGEWMRVLLDAVMDGAEAGVAEQDDGLHGDDQPLRLGPVEPGRPASGRAWVHVLDGPPGPPARLCATAFTAHDGATVEAGAATFQSPMLDSFDLQSSHEIVVTVAVPERTRPGTYHGHILATSMPEVSLAVCLEVAE
jgi:hypothetical protein